MPERLRDLLTDLAAILLGVAAFFVFCGWWVLIPTNIAWLDYYDRAMHQLGWMFYRDTPWSFPPGMSPRLGLEVGNSIGLVDGLPLFAFPFKLIEHWLPRPFQYFGYWLLLSFALQAFFGARIARELGAGRLLALAAAAFVLITPAYLYRIPMHLALSGHWVVLAGLYLNVRRTSPAAWMWPLLAGLTAAIHVTLLAMVGALWAASWLQRAISRQLSWTRAIVEPLLVAGVAGLVLWLGGYFATGSYGSFGYGSYKLNLMWPLLTYRWSQIVPDWPHQRFDYEGLSFLGIGILALLVVAVVTGAVARVRDIFSRRWWPLAVMLVALMVFAFSQKPAFGPQTLFEIDMPGFIDRIGDAFRSTGRFVWPLLYIITIGAVVLVARRLPFAIALPLVLVAFTAQAIDSSREWRRFATQMAPPSATWQTEFTSPFWERAAAAGFNRVRVIPIRSPGIDWKPVGYYAVTHGMETDSAYLGRIDQATLRKARLAASQTLATGDFEPRTLYLLGVAQALAAMAHLEPGDLLATIDGRIVFARKGAFLIDGLGISNTISGEGGSWLPPVAYGGARPD